MRARETSHDTLSKSCLTLARLAHHLPRGQFRLATFFLKLASDRNSTLSIYGPKLSNRWHDTTFRFCVSGYYGRYLSDFLCELKYPFSFLDVGANIGLYSLVAARNPHCQNCWALEPNPTVFASLEANIILNHATNITAYNLAISDRSGRLHFAASEEHTGAGSLSATAREDSIEVQCASSEMFDEIGVLDSYPKVVKIDVEGHEPIVIGELAKSSLWSHIQYLYFEANAERYDSAALFRQLNDNGLELIHREAQGDDYNLMFRRRCSESIQSESAV